MFAEAKLATETMPFIDWQRGVVGSSSLSVVTLRPQSLAVLRILHENIGSIVSKEKIMAAVWPGLSVTDDSLVQCIAEIRKAIGDVDHTLIKTLPKRGYIYQPKQSNAPVLQIANGKGARFLLGACILAFLFGIAVTTMLRHQTSKAVELPAIAVLPFNNLGTDPKGDKFAEMMTEDVITDLSHSKDFAVIARNSTDVYKGKPVDVRKVGRDLNVVYVLEGSVQALPGRVRATAQLINPITNAHIWSERYEAQGDDVFTVEAEITNRIATSILGHDAAAANNERSLIRRKPPQQWSAYDAYQAGLEASHRMSPDYLPKAEEMFSKSLAIDANFARAHVGLAWVNFLKILFGQDPPVPLAENLDKMLAEAKIAVNLDSEDGEAHAVLAQAYSMLHQQSKMAAEAERALSLAPNNADILVMTSMFLEQTGQSDLAVANLNKALSLNPNYPFWYNTSLYASFFYAGEYVRSYRFAKEAAKAAPVNSDFLAMNAAHLGKMDEAAQAKQALLAIDPDWAVERLLTNFGEVKGKELERLVTGATKAGLRICLTKLELAELPGAIHIEACDVERKRG